MPPEPDAGAVTREDLTPVVRRLLGDEAAEVIAWQSAALGWMNIMDAQLSRVAGDAQGRAGRVPWSVILKTFPKPPPDRPSTPEDWHYWKREVNVYTSGALDDLPGELTAPRWLGVAERSDGSLWLWLEDIQDAVEGSWPRQRYRDAARQMGRFNAEYLDGHRPRPQAEGLGPGGLRSWVEQLTQGFDAPPETRRDPLFARAVPDLEAVRRVRNDRGALLDALDAVPRTFVHRDAWPANVLVRRGAGRSESMVAIDWALAGEGALGEDVTGIVGPSLWFFLVGMDEATKVEAAVLEGYIDGLHDGGWTGDEAQVRFGYAASLALRFGLLIPTWAGWLAEDEMGGWCERKFARPRSEIADGWAQVLTFILGRADEASRFALG